MNEYLEKFHLQYFLEHKRENRYWWFLRNQFMPPVYTTLDEPEFLLLMEWFRETDKRGVAGECSVPLISALLGFIAGSGIDAVVQLGHAYGYSSLLMGWMLRRMGKKHALFSIDINPDATAFAQHYIDKADLNEVVALRVGNSADPKMVDRARQYFGKEPQMIFIDSSHQYKHTLNELRLYYNALPKNGIIFLHDISRFATRFDKTGKGGVMKAVCEFVETNLTESGLFNRHIEGSDRDAPLILLDGCGLGVIQKL